MADEFKAYQSQLVSTRSQAFTCGTCASKGGGWSDSKCANKCGNSADCHSKCDEKCGTDCACNKGTDGSAGIGASTAMANIQQGSDASVNYGQLCKLPWDQMWLPDTKTWSDCSNSNDLVQQFFVASPYTMVMQAGRVIKNDDASALKGFIEDELVGALSSAETVTVEVYPNKMLIGVEPYGLVVRVGVETGTVPQEGGFSASRRVLGGAAVEDVSTNLSGKPGSDYTCDYYSAVVVTTPQDPSNIKCQENDDGRGKICEPLITASLLPCTNVDCAHDQASNSFVGYNRTSNDEDTCRKVDVAVRKGVNEFRFGIAEGLMN